MEEEHLDKLAELTISISRLPDARNESREAMQITSNSDSLIAEPGGIITINGGKV